MYALTKYEMDRGGTFEDVQKDAVRNVDSKFGFVLTVHVHASICGRRRRFSYRQSHSRTWLRGRGETWLEWPGSGVGGSVDRSCSLRIFQSESYRGNWQLAWCDIGSD